MRNAIRKMPAAKARLFAKGRMRAGEMNGTERRYAELLAIRKAAGEVLWYAFEPVTFKLALDTRYTPDFAILLADNTLEFHEVKGSVHVISDDSLVKWKTAGELFPCVFRMCVALPRNEGGGWKIRTYGESA